MSRRSLAAIVVCGGLTLALTAGCGKKDGDAGATASTAAPAASSAAPPPPAAAGGPALPGPAANGAGPLDPAAAPPPPAAVTPPGTTTDPANTGPVPANATANPAATTAPPPGATATTPGPAPTPGTTPAAPGTTPGAPGASSTFQKPADGKVALFEDDETNNPAPADVAAGPKTSARFKLTATALAEEYIKNPDAFKKKYNNKKVEVTGVVIFLNRGFTDETDNLELNGVEDKEHFRTIRVTLSTGQAAPWRFALPGQTVRVTGTMGDIAGPAMTQCKVEKVAGEPWKPRAAEDLSWGFEADASKAEAKLTDRSVAISGEVAKVEFNDVKAATVTLKTPDGSPGVVCLFPAWEERATSKLKPGDKIRLVGRNPSMSDGKVELKMCVLGQAG